MIVSYDDLHRRCTRILTDLGVPHSDAATQVDVLIEGDARRQPSHGVRRLETLVGRIENGMIAPTAELRMTWVTDAVLDVDAADALGPVAAVAAVDALSERASSTGVALAAVHGSNHLGMLAYYVERVVAHGQVCFAFTTSEALVHPWGGADALVGTNPIGIGVPSRTGAVLLDMATAEVSAGKIIDHMKRDVPLGHGWAVDKDGVPTTDAEAAMEGALTPFGGAKGYALGIALETFVAAITGTAYGADKHGTLDVDRRSTKGDVFVVIDPRRIRPDFRIDEVDDYLASVRSSRPAPGGAAVRVPGDRARATSEASRVDGVEVADAVWTWLVERSGENERVNAYV